MQSIDWAKLIMAILDRLVISQGELAKRCRVAQQTVSTWKKGKNPPGVSARRRLMQLAGEAGINLVYFASTPDYLEQAGEAAESPFAATTVSWSEGSAKATEEVAEPPPKSGPAWDAYSSRRLSEDVREFAVLLETMPLQLRQELREFADFKLNQHQRRWRHAPVS
jgi:transcriptional regulator with XRE-family HTH domain